MAGTEPMTIFAPADRDATLRRVLELLEADVRLEAAVLTGSLGSQTADRWSDIDVAALVAHGRSCEQVAADWVSARYRDLPVAHHYEAALVAHGRSCEQVAADWVSARYRDLPVAHHYETAFGTTLVRGFLLGSGLVVDLAFTPSSDFTVWAPVRVAFDRTGTATKAIDAPESWSPTPDWQGEAGFGWHDVLHACIAANRGKPWQALYFLQRVRNRTLALASERHGFDADEFKHVDELPSPERDPLLASLVSDLTRTNLLAAIDVAARAFIGELRRGEPALADRLEPPLALFVQASRDEGAEQSS